MNSLPSDNPAPAAVGALKAWWLAIRPKTLTLALAPVMVAAGLAWADSGQILWWPLLAAALAAVLIQIGTNLHNDAADFERGADTPDRQGPARAAASGWIDAGQVRRGAYRCFGGAFLIGIYLAWLGGWFIVVLGLLSLAAGLAYTGGRRPIAYSALGELFVFLFFGVGAVAGTYYLQTLEMTPATLLSGAAVGMLAAAVLVVNNYRDLETDRRANKFTLATRLGRRGTRRLYAMLILLPFPATLLIAEGEGTAWLPWLALPMALQLLWRFNNAPPGPRFNQLLARTAQLQLVYGILLGFALVAQRW